MDYTRVYFFFFILSTTVFWFSEAALVAYYVPSPCGSTMSLSDLTSLSFQLESDTALVYDNNIDCSITISAPTNQLVLANIKRFELEPKRSGICNDYVNLHDGGSVSSVILNSDVTCGSLTSLSNTTYVTTGSEITLHFVTDSTAVYLGFNIIFTAITTGACDSVHYACNNSVYCIPAEFACDNYDQCGDNSDETSCAAAVVSDSFNWTPLIVGLSLGFAALVCVIAYVIYRRHRNNRWKAFQNEHIDREDVPDPDPSYPVTHKYFRGIRGHPDVSLKGKMTSYDATSERDGNVASPSMSASPELDEKKAPLV